MKVLRKTIIKAITDELSEAEKQHPDWPLDPLHQIAIVNEESGEATQAALQYVYENGPYENIKNELIQTAAMCIRMIENL